MVDILERAKESYLILAGKNRNSSYCTTNKRVRVSLSGFRMIVNSDKARAVSCRLICSNLLAILNLDEPGVPFSGCVVVGSRLESGVIANRNKISKDELYTLCFEFFSYQDTAAIKREYDVLVDRLFRNKW
jgi:hypothetical protein